MLVVEPALGLNWYRSSNGSNGSNDSNDNTYSNSSNVSNGRNSSKLLAIGRAPLSFHVCIP